MTIKQKEMLFRKCIIYHLFHVRHIFTIKELAVFLNTRVKNLYRDYYYLKKELQREQNNDKQNNTKKTNKQPKMTMTKAEKIARSCVTTCQGKNFSLPDDEATIKKREAIITRYNNKQSIEDIAQIMYIGHDHGLSFQEYNDKLEKSINSIEAILNDAGIEVL